MKKVFRKLDEHDEEGKQKAVKRVSSFSGTDSITMDMTVNGDADPVGAVNELRKDLNVDILTIVPEKEEEKENGKKEEPAYTDDERQKAELDEQKKKAEIKKLLYKSEDDSIYRHMASTSEERPNSCVIC
ncbi:hypothetical protein Peur_041612 [Populus x canadensis]|uniref:Uncharacterized protein n=1 Tax=Populus deltoides TaxID=3696 RepID=A0A8T2Y3I6_POPDE|nr:hypothetical protein H0E87_015027 [Populus deltoides]